MTHYYHLSPSHTLQMRSDGRFGETDYGLKPQIYSEEFPHLPYVPTASHPNYPYSFLWRALETSDLESDTMQSRPHERRALTDRAHGLVGFQTAMLCSQARYVAGLVDGRCPRNLLRRFYQRINLAQSRILLLPEHTSYLQLCLLWGQLQRLGLEIAAYMEFTNIHYRAFSPSPNSTTWYVGAVTTEETIVSQLHQHGVPVWHLKSSPVAHTHIPPFRSCLQPTLAPTSSMLPVLGEYDIFDSTIMDAIDEIDSRFAMDSSAYHIQTLPNTSRNAIPTSLVLPSYHEHADANSASRTHRFQPCKLLHIHPNVMRLMDSTRSEAPTPVGLNVFRGGPTTGVPTSRKRTRVVRRPRSMPYTQTLAYTSPRSTLPFPPNPHIPRLRSHEKSAHAHELGSRSSRMASSRSGHGSRRSIYQCTGVAGLSNP